MCEKSGTRWTCTLLGCLATLLAPAPFVIPQLGTKFRAIRCFARNRMSDDSTEDVFEEEEDPMQEAGRK